MRALYLLDIVAFAVCLQVQSSALSPGGCSQTPGILDRLRMAIVANDVCQTRTFQGSLYGVTATAELDLYSRKARVQLSGLVLGGGLSGTGWLESSTDSDRGTVVLDDELAAALAWRRVKIVSASLDRETDTVTICATIPVLGFQKIVLNGVS